MLNNKEIFDKMTIHAKHSIDEAKNIAIFYKSKTINPEHLLFAIFLEKGSLGSNILNDFGIKKSFFEKNLIPKKNKLSKKEISEITLSKKLKNIIVQAYSLANKFKYPYVGTEHLAFSIMKNPSNTVAKILYLSGSNKKFSLKKSSTLNSKNSTKPKTTSVPSNIKIESLDKGALSDILKALNIPGVEFPSLSASQKNSKQTPALDYFCTNLNKEVKKNNNLIIGREYELEQVITSLGRKNKNNPLLIGDPGVGKTALVEGLARKINSGDVPSHLITKQILSLDMALVVAGTSFRGEFEQRLKDIIMEASNNKDIILFIDEIHSIVGAGNTTGGLDAANILKPALTQGTLQCIGATTLVEYKKYIEKDSALERRFQTILLKEPTKKETAKILLGIKKRYEQFHNIKITKEAINFAVNLSSRYIKDRFQPDKTIDLIDETSSRIRHKKEDSTLFKKIFNSEKELKKIIRKKNKLVKINKFDDALKLQTLEKDLLKNIKQLKRKQLTKSKLNIATITKEDVAETVSILTKIPTSKLLSQVSGKIKNIHRRLNSQIIGQKEAIKKISETVLRSQVGVSDENKPIGSFLFLGPSGVGKTLTAKTLTKEFFSNKRSLIKIDMSEFTERHSVSQLLGAPAGYVGYGEGGRLTEQIRRQPYSLVLFDEIEKAHPDVFNILLQILEDGILTDAEGQEVNFKNTIIILTSNIGTEEFTKASEIGFDLTNRTAQKNYNQANFQRTKTGVLQKLEEKIRPEILNRLDNIIVFNPLNNSDLKKIAILELKKLQKRLRKMSIDMSYNQKVVSFIVENNPSKQKGARYIQKNIRDLIENIVAEEVSKKNPHNKLHLTIKNKQVTVL